MRRVLISVSDKRGVREFARGLHVLGAAIISTGGTARLLREEGIPVEEVSHYTGFPEMLDGRVKTLHPKIHGGLLALRDNAEHLDTIREHNIPLIDMVVVNLYPFEKVAARQGASFSEVIENIDIGGPSMLRSAAKNHQSVAVVCNPDRYGGILQELQRNEGALSEETMRALAVEAFELTSRYDSAIFSLLNARVARRDAAFPQQLSLHFEKVQDVRYGENPHQRGAFYREKGVSRGLMHIRQLQGKELSFNNLLDLNAAFGLVQEFRGPAAVVVKHNNPCGAAEDARLEKALHLALRCDALSAFGGIVALNRKMNAKAASCCAAGGFLECIIAPGFDAAARKIFLKKRNLRLIELKNGSRADGWDLKRVNGGLLVQEKDTRPLSVRSLRVVTRKKPTAAQMESLLFAWKVAKHVKSNAIVLARGRRTVGIGAGQMSRVDSVMLARLKAGALRKGTCLASDAFFPKPDAIAEAARAGVAAVIQPGGSIADQEIIRACDRHKIGMVFTGIRHFKH
ncbi:MAG: bifunctional phosphoribosylaminoimidazolecarboxamide formyltransferase/IMP cyclohydrolase [Candidatus Omnitrophica bacterium]|nr:bifunctional phosphoribosylaminoimidazolecarboxamide formyltransferase/IMP cyclohydrolase [Candidatus Omnitrophota bacterium]